MEEKWFAALWGGGRTEVLGPFDYEEQAADAALDALREQPLTEGHTQAFVYMQPGKMIPAPFVGDPQPNHDRVVLA